ncbi:hypothetical protein DB30_00649 [Enhygromyxa salina]|uniref:Uncharacterized protein n=1 Tax=Enhygromyxa salina TaxID=215803 RepID=A0A0C1ZLF5_9BACT|nr:hypothetical protein DB30_00649 [Enhygromyxa salina]
MLVGACGPGSADTSSGESTTSPESSSDATTTATNPETSDETTDTPTTTEADDCDTGGLDWCDDGDFQTVITDCDMFAQDCPDGMKCVPFAENGPSWDGTKCVPVNSTGAPGEPCTTEGVMQANDDCDATSFCFGYDQDLMGGTCHPFCTGDISMPACIDGWVCAVAAQGPSLCVQACDPLINDCGAGSECVWTGSLFGCVDEGESVPADQACMFVNDCDASLACVGADAVADCAGDGCCTPYCNLLDGDGPCQMVNPAHVCEPFFMEAPPGYEDVGVCVVGL